MAASRPTSKLYDLDVTIVSAKHLQNVNWRNGDLKPYVIFWVDPDRRLATKSDDSGSTRPVWNERFVIPLTLPPQDSFLTLEIFQSKPSETTQPLVGTLQFQLKDLVDSDDSTKLGNFELRRPSGRPQGKIRLELALRERPMQDYQVTPPPSFFYSTAASNAPPPSAARDYRGYLTSPYTSHLPPPPPPPSLAPSPLTPHSYQYSGYSDSYSSYFPGYYSQQLPPPPPPSRPFFGSLSSYGGPGPSAPVDYAPYELKRGGGRTGLGTGLAVGAVAGAVGGLAVEEGIKYEEDKIADRVESDLAAKDDYRDCYY